jgi:hypothetical protein
MTMDGKWVDRTAMFLRASGPAGSCEPALPSAPGGHSTRPELDSSVNFRPGRGFQARQLGEDVQERDYTTPETLVLSQIPAWRHLGREQYRDRIREMIHEIECETRTRHREAGTRPHGVKKIRAASPLASPSRPKRSPAPDFHVATREVRRLLREAYRRFLAAFLAASRELRNGDRSVTFPAGCFPPGLCYQPYPRARSPG